MPFKLSNDIVYGSAILNVIVEDSLLLDYESDSKNFAFTVSPASHKRARLGSPAVVETQRKRVRIRKLAIEWRNHEQIF